LHNVGLQTITECSCFYLLSGLVFFSDAGRGGRVVAVPLLFSKNDNYIALCLLFFHCKPLQLQ